MVAKREKDRQILRPRYLLAKIHMVAKLKMFILNAHSSYLLAKIHMVAKPQTDFIT